MFEIVSFYSSIDDAGRYFENIEVIDTASNTIEPKHTDKTFSNFFILIF